MAVRRAMASGLVVRERGVGCWSCCWGGIISLVLEVEVVAVGEC
jgi:hypothetical protein